MKKDYFQFLLVTFNLLFDFLILAQYFIVHFLGLSDMFTLYAPASLCTPLPRPRLKYPLVHIVCSCFSVFSPPPPEAKIPSWSGVAPAPQLAYWAKAAKQYTDHPPRVHIVCSCFYIYSPPPPEAKIPSWSGQGSSEDLTMLRRGISQHCGSAQQWDDAQ
eukprot:sb/3472883/